VLVAVNLQTSFLTPPMAMSAYYLKGIAPKGIHLSTIFLGCLQFLVFVFITMFVMYVFPPIYEWLPNLLYGN
jgi:TRAP-type mannitol/chloroaromatic compound transport system permease large subunit